MFDARKKARKRRKGLSADDREKFSAIICEKAKEVIKNADTVMLYSPIDCEVDVFPLYSLNKNLLLPRVEGENMVACKIGETQRGAFGVLEPIGNAYEGKIDCVIVPMCAFDRELNRLGFGKGYYDRFLSVRDTLKVGVAFSCQQAEGIVPKDTDVKMDLIITEKDILR
ncbi:MAG: 5-formyltetrahydrofolate cyclo-ligase [Clostridia bacterium]|nr:5-formyltetrahydrofolate cyclo-ligase [Clostridia bacterium]